MLGDDDRSDLCFARDGLHVVVGAPAGLRVVELAGDGRAWNLAVPGLTDFAVFDDEVWVVVGQPPALQRLSLGGQALGAPHTLSGAGRLQAAPFGEPAALWSGDGPLIEWRLVEGALVSTPLDDVGPAWLVSPRRWLTSSVSEGVTLHDPERRWTTALAGRVRAGGAIFDARAIALWIESAADEEAHALVVLSMRDGAVQHRIALPPCTGARIAARRGYALMRAGDRRLLVVDLRFGKLVKEFDETRAIADFALDDTAQHVALRLRRDDGGLETVTTTYRELLAAPPLGDHEQPVRAPFARVDEASAGRAGTPSSSRWASIRTSNGAHVARPREPEAVDDPALPVPVLTALSPRVEVPLCSRGEALELLEAWRLVLGGWLERAIAEGWDTGRLCFPDEKRLPFEAEVYGILGRTRGLAGAQLEAAATQSHAAQALLAAREAALSGRHSPLATLRRDFELSSLGAEILMLVAAPVLWGELARLYGVLANDPDRAIADELLLCQLLASRASRHDVARELDPGQPLIRYGLLRPGEGRGRPFVALAPDPLVVRHLRMESMEMAADELTTLRRADRTLSELILPPELRAQLYRELARPAQTGFARLVLSGRLGSGRHTLLAALAAQANRPLGLIDASLLGREPRARVEGLRGALRRVVLRGWFPCVDGLDDVSSEDSATREQIRELFRSHPGPVAVRLPWDATPPLDPGYLRIDLRPLSDTQRGEAWRRSLARHGLTVHAVDELAQRYRVGPGIVERVCAGVRAGDGGGADTGADRGKEIDRALRQHLEVRLGTIATRVSRLATWSNVVLPADVLDSLLELIARIKHRKQVYDAWGFDRTMTSTRGLTALFQGGPGTGKSMVAGIIASELGLDLYRVDLSRVMSKWIGETERNLASVFDAAEDGQAIILFDEADSLFSKRTEVRSSVDRYANLEVNYLLQRLDSFEGIAILTTNFGGGIDTAFKRRMSLRLSFPFPDEEMREQLWRVHLPPELPTQGDFDLADLARKFQLSGGYIRNATLRAAFLAAEEQVPLTQDHLERAVRLEYREIGKLAESGILE